MRRFCILAYKNLYRRKIRSFLTIGGVGVAVAVLVSLLGFNEGYRLALEKDVSGMGYQVLVTAKGCPYELATVALAGAGALRYLSDDTVRKIRQDAEVADLTPELLHPLGKETGIGFYSFWGIDRSSFTRLRPMLKIASGKHTERIKGTQTSQEREEEPEGDMGRWFIPKEVPPDEIYLKNGRVVRGLIVGEGVFEKVVGQELDPISGDYKETKRTFRTIKVMLPSRIYNNQEVAQIESVMKLRDGAEIKGAIKKVNEQFFQVDGERYSADQVVSVEDLLILKDGTSIRGVILDQSGDRYIVGDIELAYPNTEEIAEELIATDEKGARAIIQQPIGETEVVVGWEAAQTGFLKVGQKLILKVKEMVREKTKETRKDPVTGQEREFEREEEKPIFKDYAFRVVGILERSGSKDDGSYFIQLEAAQRIFQKYKMLTDIGIQLRDLAKLPMFTDRLYNRKELGEIQIISLSEVKGTILNLVQTAKILVMAVAFIAIFVSLIGVMNTILMSVFERTQEIGIMKAIGASRKDIFTLIWLETIIICVLGGLLGTGIAVVGGTYIEKTIRLVMSQAGYVPGGRIVHFTPEILISCFIGAIILGVLSGIWPAYRAAKMSPIEAIRSGE